MMDFDLFNRDFSSRLPYKTLIPVLVAASNDLAFNMRGYVFVLLNDFFTAANGVLIKKKLESKV